MQLIEAADSLFCRFVMLTCSSSKPSSCSRINSIVPQNSPLQCPGPKEVSHNLVGNNCLVTCAPAVSTL